MVSRTQFNVDLEYWSQSWQRDDAVFHLYVCWCHFLKEWHQSAQNNRSFSVEVLSDNMTSTWQHDTKDDTSVWIYLWSASICTFHIKERNILPGCMWSADVWVRIKIHQVFISFIYCFIEDWWLWMFHTKASVFHERHERESGMWRISKWNRMFNEEKMQDGSVFVGISGIGEKWPEQKQNWK